MSENTNIATELETKLGYKKPISMKNPTRPPSKLPTIMLPAI